MRGGGEQFIEEAERSLHDAIMIVRRARKTHSVVAGGGAIEVRQRDMRREGEKKEGGKVLNRAVSHFNLFQHNLTIQFRWK